jgi:hypothetical protein
VQLLRFLWEQPIAIIRQWKVYIRVARWQIFKPKIPIWVNFKWSCNERWWFIYGHLVYFTAIWYISWPLGIFSGYLVIFPVLVCYTKKNLATLVYIRRAEKRKEKYFFSLSKNATERKRRFWRFFPRKKMNSKEDLLLGVPSSSVKVYQSSEGWSRNTLTFRWKVRPFQRIQKYF